MHLTNSRLLIVDGIVHFPRPQWVFSRAKIYDGFNFVLAWAYVLTLKNHSRNILIDERRRVSADAINNCTNGSPIVIVYVYHSFDADYATVRTVALHGRRIIERVITNNQSSAAYALMNHDADLVSVEA